MNIQSALVRSILDRWEHYEWTIQGFGMARVKLSDVGRIHVWDSRLAVPLVSTAHAHPWPLKSTIISGELINQRFTVDDSSGRLASEALGELAYSHSRIKTGEGGNIFGEERLVLLKPAVPEVYTTGQSYSQEPQEVHRTIAQDGTVTLIERPMGPPLQETDVFWPYGTKWVSAEPRAPHTVRELAPIIHYALMRWAAQ